MINGLLVEPAAYTYVGDDVGSFSVDTFDGFWKQYSKLMLFVESNDARIVCSSELRSSAGELFPFSTVRSGYRVGRHTPQEAAALVLRFLARYLVTPVPEYECSEDLVETLESITNARPLYQDGNVWPAWCDVLAKRTQHRLKEEGYIDQLLATGCRESCVVRNSKSVSIRLTGHARNVVYTVHLINRSEWPAGYLDPELLARLRERKVGMDVDIDFEKSGHQPKTAIKRALIRTARDAGDIVLRMVTTYYNPNAVDTCKMEPGQNPTEIQFRVSDRQEVVKGMFVTTAQSLSEQTIAMEVVRRRFVSRCQKEGFDVE